MIKKAMHEGVYSGKVMHSKSGQNYIASITRYSHENYNNELHAHENAHFSYMLSGGCVEKKKSEYELTPGNITYYDAGQNHQVKRVVKDSMRVNLEFDQTFFGHNSLSNDHLKSTVYKNPDAKFLLMKVYRELVLNDSFSDLSIQMLFLQLTVPKFVRPINGSNPNWVAILDEYLRCDMEKELTLSKLSDICNLHPVTLSKQFPLYFNCTLGQYKRKLMVERALPFVISSDLSLCDIALECGFFDQSHFTRTFKQCAGISPKNYRKF